MKKEQLISAGGVIALALTLPIMLRVLNAAQRLAVGAEGRLAAIAIETDRPLGPMPQPWRALAQGGEELTTFLDGDMAGKVAAIRPAQVRIDHVYDGFNVVSRGAGGQLAYDWSRLDEIVKKIQSTGAQPFFSLGYMPLAISKSDIVDEPRDYGEWTQVVRRTIEHYSGQLGLSGIYYEVWNEPDLFGSWKMGGRKDYRKLYSAAAIGAAQAGGVRPFKLGGPGTTGLYRNWLDNFFPYVLKNNLRLDFFSWHRYALDTSQYTEDVDNVDKWLDSHPYFTNVEKVISEMGPSSDKKRVNDSIMGGVHLMAVTREELFKIDYGFSFAVKDAPGSVGGWGLIGSNGPKPRYEAMRILGRLGKNRLGTTGEGSYVRALAAQDGDKYQVLVFNYDPKNAHSELVPVTFINLRDHKFSVQKQRFGTADVLDWGTEIATDEAMLQARVSMTPNSALFLELTPHE